MYEIENILSTPKWLEGQSNKKDVFAKDSIFMKWLFNVTAPVTCARSENMEVAWACRGAVIRSGIKTSTFDKCLLQYYKKVSHTVRYFEMDARLNGFTTVQIPFTIFEDIEFVKKVIDWGVNNTFSIIETLPHEKMVFEIGYVRFKVCKTIIDGVPSLVVSKYAILDDLMVLLCEFTVQDGDEEMTHFVSVSQIPFSNTLSALSAKQLNFRGTQLDAWKIIKKIPNIIAETRLRSSDDPDFNADNIEYYDFSMDVVTVLLTLEYCIMQNRAKGSKKHQEVPVKVYMDSDTMVRERVLYHDITVKEYGDFSESHHRNIGPREAVCYSTPEWETRGHWRHYKNGRKVFIKPHKCRRHGHDGEYSPQVKIVVK